MKTKEFINNIKSHFNSKQTYNSYFDFYCFLENEEIEDIQDFPKLNYFWGELADIYEQAEPWNDVKYFKPLDDQLRELLKKYKL